LRQALPTMPQLPQTEHGTNGGSNLTGSPIRKEKKSFATQSPISRHRPTRRACSAGSAIRCGRDRRHDL